MNKVQRNGGWFSMRKLEHREAEASIAVSFCLDLFKQYNMLVSPCGEMLLRNKEPSGTKNLDFSCHLPSKEGTKSNNFVPWSILYETIN